MATEETEEQKIERIAAQAAMVAGKIKPRMVAGVMQLIEALAKPYKKLSEHQQEEFIASLTRRVHLHLDAAITELSGAEHREVLAAIDSFKCKGPDITINLKASMTHDNLIALGDAGVREVRLFLADYTVLDDQSVKGPQPQPDAPKLPIEEAIEEAPPMGDDADLADAGEGQLEDTSA